MVKHQKLMLILKTMLPILISFDYSIKQCLKFEEPFGGKF